MIYAVFLIVLMFALTGNNIESCMLATNKTFQTKNFGGRLSPIAFLYEQGIFMNNDRRKLYDWMQQRCL